ncbi:unnamed protein product [Ceratitis capitata]|uniref:(Mediterranean fruit fly) hypothetical protein n=1 Tax=Ceratitis capitata TaxID=7213 RepID=A0A811V951_CERCA|nr:unnamed protein product [Ceratitis capitata]
MYQESQNSVPLLNLLHLLCSTESVPYSSADNILVINQEFLADSPDSISLSRGDLVEVLKTMEGDTFPRGKLRDYKPELNSRWYVRLFGSSDNCKEGWIPTNILDFSNDTVSIFGNKAEDPAFRRMDFIYLSEGLTFPTEGWGKVSLLLSLDLYFYNIYLENASILCSEFM